MKRSTILFGLTALLILALAIPLPAAARPLQAPPAPNDITGSTLTAVSPSSIVPDTFDISFVVTFVSPDAVEYLDRFDVTLPAGWTVNTVYNLPADSGCPFATTQGVEAGNVVYWQTVGWAPGTPTLCGAWYGAPTYTFVANVTVPDLTGAPWNLSWNIYGDYYGTGVHTISGSYLLSGPNTWTGGTSTDWNIAGNWSGGVVPSSADGAYIPSGPANQPRIGAAGGLCSDLYIASGASLTLNGGNLTCGSVNNLGSLTVTGTEAIFLAGNISNTGTFNPGSGAVHFNGATVQTTVGISSFFDVFIESTSTLQLDNNVNILNNLTVATGSALDMNSFNLTGHGISTVQDVSVSGYFTFLDLYGVWIDPTNQPLGNTTVIIDYLPASSNSCVVSGQLTARRCFQINPVNTTGRNATVRFYFNELTDLPTGLACIKLKAYHYDGGGLWVLAGGIGGTATCAGANSYVEVSGVTSFSHFALSAPAPTAITLSSFSAGQSVPFVGLVGMLAFVLAGCVFVWRKRR